MRLNDFDFDLPKSLIAQTPTNNRTDSRLLVPRSTIIDAQFNQIANFIQPNDLLVLNNTRVIPARLFAHKDTGGRVEIMVERVLKDNKAIAMIRASIAPKVDSSIELENGVNVKVLSKDDSFYTLEFETESIKELLDCVGHVPLPPYIDRPDNMKDESRYQTVYATKDGAVAAPTAGLHFDNTLLDELSAKGIEHCFVTLHVGAGTFQPVKTEQIKDHVMHSEYFEINQNTVDKINQTKANGGRIIAIGTTSVRSLESAAISGKLMACREETDIFIYPGFEFKIVDMMVTNFHLPKSSLLMLVSAFIGHDKMIKAYRHAINKEYRFFSYGDAMLLEKNY
jgi:S-adenosylmethionine:tRNA ribosyltransferase-isomerase